jgi:hypothetical protein
MKISPEDALDLIIHPRKTVLAGAVGLVEVMPPGVCDRYTGVPAANADVSKPRRTPNVVIKPSAPLAIVSEVIPRVAALKGSVSASARTIDGR